MRIIQKRHLLVSENNNIEVTCVLDIISAISDDLINVNDIELRRVKVGINF